MGFKKAFKKVASPVAKVVAPAVKIIPKPASINMGSIGSKTTAAFLKTSAVVAKTTAVTAKATAIADKTLNNKYMDLVAKTPLFGELVEGAQMGASVANIQAQGMNTATQKFNGIINSGQSGQSGSGSVPAPVVRSSYETTQYIDTPGGLVPVSGSQKNNNMILIAGGLALAGLAYVMSGKKKRK